MLSSQPNADRPHTKVRLRLAVVREAVSLLQTRRIHEAFVVYLHVRHLSTLHGSATGIVPDWQGEVHEWLDVPGGPPNKPHFRPFSSRGNKPSRFWMGRNLAGSYAPSSLRPELKEMFVADDKTYRLPLQASGIADVSAIREHVLSGNTIPAWAVAAFLYRNREFEIADAAADPDPPPGQALLEVFRDDFLWTPEEESLFGWENPPVHPSFEVITSGQSDSE